MISMSSPGLGPAVHWTMLIHFTAVSTITYIFTKMMSMLKIIINLYRTAHNWLLVSLRGDTQYPQWVNIQDS